MSEITYTCPVCSNDTFQKGEELVDHFLSQEVFHLYTCTSCAVLKTEPAPDDSRIGKYYESDNYLSHGDGQKGIFARLYRLAKGYNLGWKGRLLQRLNSKASFLDYGCGTGDLITHCQELGFDVRGAEPSDSAKAHLSSLVKDRVVIPAEELLSDRRYDIISMWHVLEHIREPREILSQLKTKLNQDGHIVIALPNNASYDAHHYGALWAAWDVPRHLWHYRPDQIIALMNDLGFTHANSHPMWFDAFYVSLLSERYKKGSSIGALFWAGLSNLKALFNKKERCSSQVYVFKLN
jgi:SAM-dependent methyltransferase